MADETNDANEHDDPIVNDVLAARIRSALDARAEPVSLDDVRALAGAPATTGTTATADVDDGDEAVLATPIDLDRTEAARRDRDRRPLLLAAAVLVVVILGGGLLVVRDDTPSVTTAPAADESTTVPTEAPRPTPGSDPSVLKPDDGATDEPGPATSTTAPTTATSSATTTTTSTPTSTTTTAPALTANRITFDGITLAGGEPIRLGMTADELTAATGLATIPVEEVCASHGRDVVGLPEGIFVVFDGNDAVRAVTIRSAAFSTVEGGITVDSTVAELVRAYPTVEVFDLITANLYGVIAPDRSRGIFVTGEGDDITHMIVTFGDEPFLDLC